MSYEQAFANPNAGTVPPTQWNFDQVKSFLEQRAYSPHLANRIIHRMGLVWRAHQREFDYILLTHQAFRLDILKAEEEIVLSYYPYEWRFTIPKDGAPYAQTRLSTFQGKIIGIKYDC